MGKMHEGVVVVPVDSSGVAYCVPGHIENKGKLERVLTTHKTTLRSFENLYEFPAGAVNIEDGNVRSQALLVGALRECAEEIGMIPNISNLEKSRKRFMVEQSRDGKLINYIVNVFYWKMTVEQSEWLITHADGVPVGEDQLMRPRDAFVVKMRRGDDSIKLGVNTLSKQAINILEMQI